MDNLGSNFVVCKKGQKRSKCPQYWHGLFGKCLLKKGRLESFGRGAGLAQRQSKWLQITRSPVQFRHSAYFLFATFFLIAHQKGYSHISRRAWIKTSFKNGKIWKTRLLKLLEMWSWCCQKQASTSLSKYGRFSSLFQKRPVALVEYRDQFEIILSIYIFALNLISNILGDQGTGQDGFFLSIRLFALSRSLYFRSTWCPEPYYKGILQYVSFYPSTHLICNPFPAPLFHLFPFSKQQKPSLHISVIPKDWRSHR